MCPPARAAGSAAGSGAAKAALAAARVAETAAAARRRRDRRRRARRGGGWQHGSGGRGLGGGDKRNGGGNGRRGNGGSGLGGARGRGLGGGGGGRHGAAGAAAGLRGPRRRAPALPGTPTLNAAGGTTSASGKSQLAIRPTSPGATSSVPDEVTSTGSTTTLRLCTSPARAAAVATTPASSREASMPVLSASAPRSPSTLSICVATNATGGASTPCTPAMFCHADGGLAVDGGRAVDGRVPSGPHLPGQHGRAGRP